MEQWQCTDLAHMLLKDDDLVNKYEQEYKKEEFVRKVLKDWLSRDGGDSAVPRVLGHLLLSVSVMLIYLET